MKARYNKFRKSWKPTTWNTENLWKPTPGNKGNHWMSTIENIQKILKAHYWKYTENLESPPLKIYRKSWKPTIENKENVESPSCAIVRERDIIIICCRICLKLYMAKSYILQLWGEFSGTFSNIGHFYSAILSNSTLFSWVNISSCYSNSW